MLFHNDCAYLYFYDKSLRGKVQDFSIDFYEDQTDMEQILQFALDLFQQLMESFVDKVVVGRLVAKVNFIHFNNETDENEVRHLHFSSHSCEKIENNVDFFKRHLTKIASRLDFFNANGSNLLIKNIEHLHILLTVL